MSSTDRAWERYGQTEPYFGVLAESRFTNAHVPGTERDEFFASGERHVERVLSVIREADATFTPARVLDFGCGVGRLVIPFARRARQVVGLDVSPSMLREAGRNIADAGIANVQWLDADEKLDGCFDLIHSFIVFQHIPPGRGLIIVQRLLDHLSAGGWGALHFVHAIDAPLWWRAAYWARWHVPLFHTLCNVLQGAPIRRPFMQMNMYPVASLRELLRKNGCVEGRSELTQHGKFVGTLLFFRKGAGEQS